MARLIILVEGQTEENFVNEVLAAHLYAKKFESVSARIIGNARLRGGIRNWPSARTNIVTHLKQDQGCIATTMVDYYALPQGPGKGWPGRDVQGGTSSDKAERVQDGMMADITAEMGGPHNARRFVPYVVMHEFEALLFSDCNRFSQGVYRPDLAASFQAIRDAFESPEDINDSPVTAPSKRIQGLMPRYQKTLHGVLGILEVGLDQIRAQCPGFNRWLVKLESSGDVA